MSNLFLGIGRCLHKRNSGGLVKVVFTPQRLLVAECLFCLSACSIGNHQQYAISSTFNRNCGHDACGASPRRW